MLRGVPGGMARGMFYSELMMLRATIYSIGDAGAAERQPLHGVCVCVLLLQMMLRRE